jgi:hypothetical protein
MSPKLEEFESSFTLNCKSATLRLLIIVEAYALIFKTTDETVDLGTMSRLTKTVFLSQKN